MNDEAGIAGGGLAHSPEEAVIKTLGVPLVGAIVGAVVGFMVESARSQTRNQGKSGLK